MNRRSWLPPVIAQTVITTKEILRGGTLPGVATVWALLLLTATAFGTVSVGDRIYVIKDFGLFLTSIASVFMTVSAGAALLSKEIKQKNIYTILSKPITRTQYLLGKFLGIWVASAAVNMLLHVLLVGYIFLLEGVFSPEILFAAVYLDLEIAILSSLCLLVASLFVTPLLVGVITFLLFVAGRNLETILASISTDMSNSPENFLLRNLSAVLPHLYSFNIVNELTFGTYPSLTYMGTVALYAASYAGACFILAVYIFSKRNFS